MARSCWNTFALTLYNSFLLGEQNTEKILRFLKSKGKTRFFTNGCSLEIVDLFLSNTGREFEIIYALRSIVHLQGVSAL